MTYTNRFNLPPEITSILTRDRYNESGEDLGDYSATRLLAPIQQTILSRRYADDLKVFDVIDNFWAFVGSVAHRVLEEHACGNGLYEKRFYAEIMGKKISGQVDHYKDAIITDFKSCRAYKIMRGCYDEWERQLNIYAWLAQKNSMPVTRLRIFAFILDWKQQDTYQKNYPACPIMEIPLPLWKPDRIEQYVTDRVTFLRNAEGLDDRKLAETFPCASHEMWQDLKDHAIYNRHDTERKRAKKVIKSDTNMLTCDVKSDEILVPRYTERRRCLYHCVAANHCVQHHDLCQAEGRPTENTEFIF